MYECCRSCQYPVRPTVSLFTVALLLVIGNCGTALGAIPQWSDQLTSDQLTSGQLSGGQISGGQQAISSSEFLQQLPSSSLPTNATTHQFPFQVQSSQSSKPEPNAVPADYEQPQATQPQQAVKTVGYESHPSASTPIGTGVATNANAISTRDPLSPSSESIASMPIAPPTQSQKPFGWSSVLALDPKLPDFLIGYEAISIRRSNDSVGPYSQGADMERFGRDLAGRYTFTRLLGTIEQIEFKFTGPFHWERGSTTTGPIDSNLPLALSSPFDNASLHQQSQRVRLASYELNRCYLGDELSKFYYGLRIIDHGEEFQLESTQGATISQFGLRADNLLAGWQLGLQLNRPLSQRLSVGIGTSGGLYGDFAKGVLTSTTGSSTNADLRDSKLRLTTVWEMIARTSYRISENVVATAGYELWYFPSLTTVADQRLNQAAQSPAFALRTSDDQLFRGWTVGLSARF